MYLYTNSKKKCKIYFVFISFLWGVFVRGVFVRRVFVQGVFVRGFLSGGFCLGGFCPRTYLHDLLVNCIENIPAARERLCFIFVLMLHLFPVDTFYCNF